MLSHDVPFICTKNFVPKEHTEIRNLESTYKLKSLRLEIVVYYLFSLMGFDPDY